LVVAVLGVLVVRVGWRRALGAGVVAALIVAPWVWRNGVQVDTYTVITSNGFNLAAVYSAEAQAAGGFVDPVFHPGFDDMRLLQFDEAAWDAELRRRGLENLRDNPGCVATVVGRNTLAPFELRWSLTDGADHLDGRNMAVRRWTRPLVWVVTVAGLAGLWRRRTDPFVLVLSMSAAVFVVQCLLVLPWPRLRAPLDYACCVGAALLVDRLIRSWACRVRGRSSPSR
jgi:hypothetical protein